MFTERQDLERFKPAQGEVSRRVCQVDLPSNSTVQSIGEKSIMDENKYFKDGMRERGGKGTITHFKNFVRLYKMYDFF